MSKPFASTRLLARLFAAFAALLVTLVGAAKVAQAASASIVISQVYGGGGNSGATYKNDFIELFNRGSVPVNVTNWSVQYASSTGTTWQVTVLSGTIQPGQYYLVQEALGAGGTVSLPTPDATGSIPMSATTGKVALVNATTALTGACPTAGVVDFVGFGSANCSETAPTAALTNTTAAIRLLGGCTETDNNQTDFATSGGPTPRNSASPIHTCGETAPSVTSTTPASGAINVGLGTSISVTFSEPVNLALGAAQVQCPLGNVVGSSAAQSNVTSVVITPPSGLPAGTACQITVSAAGVTDVDTDDPPDNMAADFSSGFMTVAATACGAADTPIGQVQGSGVSSPVVGTQQTVQGVVVADFEFDGSTAIGDSLRGFFVQNTVDNDDDDPLTSDGIFVFNSGANSVSVGQVVQVTGTVSEYNFGSTGGTITELGSPTIEICPTTGSVTPTTVSLPLTSATDLERYEGMLVTFPQQLFVTEHFQLGRFGQVTLSGSSRLTQPTNIAAPGAPALAQQAQNDLNRIVLDDATQVQNPSPIPFGRNGSPLSASNTLRGGDWVQGLTGVLTQTDATTASNVTSDTDPVLYRVRPFNVLNGSTPNFQAANPRPSVPPVVSGNLKVAGFNLLNYFNTFGTGACTLGVGGASTDCRGADNATEFDRQSQKTVQAALGTNAAVLAVSEMENDGYGAGSAIVDLRDKLNAATAPGTWAFIDADAKTGQVNALGVDAIKVAMFYQPAKVVPVGNTRALNTGAFGIYQVTGGTTQRNRPALVQAFQELSGAHGRVVVVANHLKSKGTACDDNVSPVPADPDTGDGQGNCNLTRTAAAQQLTAFLGTNPTGTGERRILVMGDLNAYLKENPISTFTGAGYTDLIAPTGYSYVFDGQWGHLDHALAAPSLVEQVSQVLEWHINSDEPTVLDYNTEFKTAEQITSLYAPDAYRASDHDPVIVGLNLTAAAAVPAADARYLTLMLLVLGVCGAWTLRRAHRASAGHTS